MVSGISSLITTTIDLHSCLRVWDDIDSLQGIIQTRLDYVGVCVFYLMLNIIFVLNSA